MIRAICRTALLLSTTAAPLASYAQAASVDPRVLSAFESRELNRELRRTRILERAAAREPAIVWTASGGVAYTRGPDDARQTSVPVEITAAFEEKRASLTLGIDAYARATDGDGRVTGYGDPAIRFRHVLDAARAWSLSVGARVPGGSDLGSKHASQLATLAYQRSLGGAWAGAAIASVSHTNAALPPGVSNLSQSGIARAAVQLDAKGRTDAWFQFLGSHRNGAPSYREVAAGYDFPISSRFDGALTVSRGLPRDARSTSVELDVSFSF